MRERTRARGRSRETVKEEWADPLFAEAKQIPKIARERAREREKSRERTRDGKEE